MRWSNIEYFAAWYFIFYHWFKPLFANEMCVCMYVSMIYYHVIGIWRGQANITAHGLRHE